MILEDNDKYSTNYYYSSWASLGASLHGEPIKDEVDPELLFCKSTIKGRKDSRILWALLTWFIEHSHLINVTIMNHYLKYADTAVLGAIIDIAIENNADRKLLNISRKCRKKENPELLFYSAKKIPEYYVQEITQTKKQWKKWGLLSSQIETQYKAKKNINFILKNNKLLSIRAWLGANIKSEILYYLIKNNRSYASEIAKKLNFSYPPVYIEIQTLIKNGILKTENIGNITLVSLKKESKKIINNLDLIAS